MIDETDNVVQNFECEILGKKYTVLRYDNHDVVVLVDGKGKLAYECDNGDTDFPKLRACDTFNDIRDTLSLVKNTTEVK